MAQQTLAPAAAPSVPMPHLHSLRAQQQAKPWEQIPIPKLHDFKPHQPQRIELKNGIVLFLQEDHELPFVSGSVLDSRRLARRRPGQNRPGRPLWPGVAHQRHGQAQRRRARRPARSQGRAHRDRRRRGFHRALLGLAQGRLRSGFFAGHGPAFSSQIQRGEAATGPAAGGHGHCPAQRRRRRDRQPRVGQAGLRRQQPLHPPAGVGHHRRGHRGRPEGLARPHHQRQADRRHQRRLRPGGDGSQAARGLRGAAAGASPRRRATTPLPAPSPASTSSTRKT